MFVCSAIAFFITASMYLLDVKSGQNINPLAVFALTFTSLSWLFNLVIEQKDKSIIKYFGIAHMIIYGLIGLVYVAWNLAQGYYSILSSSPPPADLFLYSLVVLSTLSFFWQVYQLCRVGKTTNRGDSPGTGRTRE
jgi:hypothetical protein